MPKDSIFIIVFSSSFFLFLWVDGKKKVGASFV